MSNNEKSYQDQNRRKKLDKKRQENLLKRLSINNKFELVMLLRNSSIVDFETEKSNDFPSIQSLKKGKVIYREGWYDRMNAGDRPSAIYSFKQLNNTVTILHCKRSYNEYEFIFRTKKQAENYLNILINGRKISYE